MTTESCGNCKYLWQTEQDEERYWCRRFPPRTIVDSNGYVGSMFPETTPSHWCGEHEWIQKTSDLRH